MYLMSDVEHASTAQRRVAGGGEKSSPAAADRTPQLLSN